MTAMKRSAVLAAVFVGLFVGSARAQETVVVNVPFPFVVGHEQFPAGRYDVTTEEGLVKILGMNTRTAGIAMSSPADGHDPAGYQPSLVFVRHENEYRLAQVWDSSDDGVALPDAAALNRSKNKSLASAESTVVVVAGGF